MEILATLLVGLALGALSGGDWRRLKRVRLRALWIAPVGAGLSMGGRALVGLSALTGVCAWLAGVGLVAVVALINRRVPGMAISALGVSANAVAIAYYGHMPVLQSALDRLAAGDVAIRSHQPASVVSSVGWLGDLLPVPLLNSVASVGDLLLMCGVCAIVVHFMRDEGVGEE